MGRFSGGDFFQIGRNKAEERFWKKYIHEDGSCTTSLGSRASSEMSGISNCKESNTSDMIKSNDDEGVVNIARESNEETDSEEAGNVKEDDVEDEKNDTGSSLSNKTCKYCQPP